MKSENEPKTDRADEGARVPGLETEPNQGRQLSGLGHSKHRAGVVRAAEFGRSIEIFIVTLRPSAAGLAAVDDVDQTIALSGLDVREFVVESGLLCQPPFMRPRQRGRTIPTNFGRALLSWKKRP